MRIADEGPDRTCQGPERAPTYRSHIRAGIVDGTRNPYSKTLP
jgi:hypothetical protein